MSGTILTVAVIAYLLICIGWALLIRKLQKSRLRFFGVLISFAVAMIGTFIAKSSILNDDFIMNSVLPWIGAMLPPEFADLLAQSPTLCDVVLGCVSAIAAPIVMFAIFQLMMFLTWIVHLLITLICDSSLKEKDAESRYALPRTIALTVVQALLVLFVWMVPISAYVEVVPILADEVKEAAILDDSTQEVVDMVVEDYVKPLDNSVTLNVFRAVGVSGVSDSLTSFDVNGNTAHLKNELSSVADLGFNVFRLTQTELTSYGVTEADIILEIADSFDSSEMLPAIAGELLYNATDAWLNGEDFIGIPVETLYFEETGMFNDFMNRLILVLHTDSQSSDALCADMDTVAQMLATLIRSDILSNLDDQNALIAQLSQEGLVNSLVTTLGNNNTMKVLIPEVTNIGVRAIATTLGIKEDAGAVYAEFLDTVAADLNSVKGMTSTEQVTAVSSSLSTAFNEAGMVIDKEVIDFYSTAIVKSVIEPSGDADITPESVQGFFAVYAWNTQELYADQVKGNSANKTQTIAGTEDTSFEMLQVLLQGTVFEGMTAEELRNSGAGVLARVTYRLTLIKTDDTDPENTIEKQASEIVMAEFSTILNEDEHGELLEVLSNVTITAALSESSVNVTASLQSAETMKETTIVITTDKLLVDAQAAADKINDSNIANEAAAIENIFATAGSLSSTLTNGEEMDLAEVAGSMGVILDSLSATESYGTEQSSTLFTAVMQSSTVREAADLDMATATQMGQKGSAGDAKYEETFKNVANTVTVMGSMGANGGELKEEDIVEMIRGLNPQTAGMIEVYVTPSRLTDSYNVPANYSTTAAPLISNLFGYMAEAEMDDAQYEKEAKAINNILTITMAARDHAGDSEHNKTLFGKNGILNSAEETVEALMASKALASSLRETPFEEDPFELSELMQKDENADEEQELKDAIHNYYVEHHDAETKLTLQLIAKLLGVQDIDTILGD
ncbi:MAG: hypothetical protein IJW92_00185 [Clostridia bacterium]|nr:hypothetical protein [Clostridia bacterium]